MLIVNQQSAHSWCACIDLRPHPRFFWLHRRNCGPNCDTCLALSIPLHTRPIRALPPVPSHWGIETVLQSSIKNDGSRNTSCVQHISRSLLSEAWCSCHGTKVQTPCLPPRTNHITHPHQYHPLSLVISVISPPYPDYHLFHQLSLNLSDIIPDISDISDNQ